MEKTNTDEEYDATKTLHSWTAVKYSKLDHLLEDFYKLTRTLSSRCLPKNDEGFHKKHSSRMYKSTLKMMVKKIKQKQILMSIKRRINNLCHIHKTEYHAAIKG